MKRYSKEIVVLIVQLAMFYLFPLSAGPTDAMGMVLLIWLSTVLLGMILTVNSNNKIKYFYPVAIAVLFIPSVFIYYNSSALIHAVWHFVGATIGVGVGWGIRAIALAVAKLSDKNKQ
ncbi:MAG: hypothetical protein IJX75_01265 [Clostridia bacterium]|nr:hypothetical protein [Clostridia bacterium]